MSRQDAIVVQKPDDGEISPEELAKKIAQWIGEENHLVTAIPTLTFYRFETPTEPMSYMLPPSICLIAQGAKRVLLGDEVFTYNAQTYLITSVNLPVVAQITEASMDKPYLGLTLELDQRTIAQLMMDSNLPPLHRNHQKSRGMAVSKVSLPLLNAFQRLIDLLDQPEDIPILAPLIQREIIYRLLVGDQGPRMRQIGAVGSQSHSIVKTIDWMKNNFASRLSIDNLAAYTGMSTSTFHHHFHALTAMSPLQFQKKLRLNEARRLMLMENFDATTAALKVGYESPSQFSREYNRLFGAPPLRDIKNLHRISAVASG